MLPAAMEALAPTPAAALVMAMALGRRWSLMVVLVAIVRRRLSWLGGGAVVKVCVIGVVKLVGHH